MNKTLTAAIMWGAPLIALWITKEPWMAGGFLLSWFGTIYIWSPDKAKAP